MDARRKLAVLAPAPPAHAAAGNVGDHNNGAARMAFSCQTCARRKVKCDKAAPTCARCRKSNAGCVYEAPRPRKRRLSSDDALDRLARYERVLRRHGLLEEAHADTVPTEEPVSLLWDEPETPGNGGKLLSAPGKSRYLSSKLWQNLECEEVQGLSDTETEEDDPATPDPLTGAFLGGPQRSLLQYHPTHEQAMVLWATYAERVEPLCKILHIPSTARLVETVSQQPAAASKTDECLLFAIYYFAVFSLTDEECAAALGRPRSVLLPLYQSAARQALVNASFLKTTSLTVLQSLVLLLLASQHSYSAHTFWILTGAAVRIALRMGLHRDGESSAGGTTSSAAAEAKLSPFDVEMRRRLFYQLLPLDARAGQAAGAGVAALPPDAWDTRPPRNVDDAQLWPGMAAPPAEQRRGATEMLLRPAGARAAAAAAAAVRQPWMFADVREADRAIDEAEAGVEERFIRYCDVVDPLHFLTVCVARAGIAACRLRVRLPRARSEAATEEERREAWQLALKILDADAAVCLHAGLRKYRWYLRHFFVWGTWDSMIVVLISLARRRDFLSAAEIDAAWDRIEHQYGNHDELAQSWRPLYLALGRLALKAWDANPPTRGKSGAPEPGFIAALRSACTRKKQRKEGWGQNGEDTDTTPGLALDKSIGATDFDLSSSFDVAGVDWVFWPELIQDGHYPAGHQSGDLSFSP
ncbi:7af7ab83-10b3-4e93-a708-402ec278c1e0 [Thermothielavioides terrestris]|uniref:7af7ab83-10b3-4e93-a708-402ec278c1e0 n=1 Tax=Thermothielavioides terrestris TaxID=2587410 RepID=A0A3S4AXQ2_9PEZI|nr:7af7ab83-10b3-4e93-a708-402ec278c1e0 [Thermothielavioides terrestris]